MTQTKPHDEDDQAENKNKAEALTNSSYICLEDNYQTNVKILLVESLHQRHQ